MERMAPGALTLDGFLGDDTRSLYEIIEADRAQATHVRITPETLAERLQHIQAAAFGGLGRPVLAGAHLTAVYDAAIGRIPCPFGRCGLFEKGEIHVTNTATGETVTFTPLSVHMLKAHGFGQGRGSRYRLDPVHLVRLLENP